METQFIVSQTKLQVHIKYSNKIELSHYINSLNSLNNEYYEYLRFSSDHLQPEDIRLYVNEIKTGSIITDLIAYSPTLLAFAEHANTIIDFTKHLYSNINILRTKNPKDIANENAIKANSLSNIQGLVETILNDPNGQISFNGLTFGDNCNVTFSINSSEAQEIYHKAQEIKDFKPTSDSNIKEQALLVFTQTNGSTKNINSDKGIIESISKSAIKVRFASDKLKKSMLLEQHPYRVAYVVDVEIETVDNKPKLYKVLKFYECIDIDE